LGKVKKKILALLPFNDLSIGALKSTLVRTGSLISGFVLQIVLARNLTKEAFGDYTYVITLLGFLALFGRLGFDIASKRFIPKYAVDKKTDLVHQFILFSILIPFAISLLIIGIGELVLINADLGYSEQLRQTIRTGWWLLPTLILLNILVAQLESVKKILTAQIPHHLARPNLMTVAVLLSAYISGVTLDAGLALALNAGISFLLLLLLFALSKKAFKHRWKWDSTIISAYKKEWLSVAMPLLLTAGLHLVLNQADIIIIRHFLESEDVGLYAVAFKLASLVLFGLTAVNVIAAPLISEYYTAGKQEALQKMIAVSIAMVFGMALLLGTLLFLLDELILGIYGSSFVAAAGVLSILIVANVLNTSTGPVSFVLTMTNYHMESLYILIISAIINIGLNIALIPRFGIEGAAYATLTSTIIWNFLMYIVAYKKLKLDTSLFSLRFLLRKS
jgi:O-antigen/teichoic acid export membrane protein